MNRYSDYVKGECNSFLKKNFTSYTKIFGQRELSERVSFVYSYII